MRAARADLRRRRRGGEAADDGIHERRAGEDARVPPQRTGDIRACRRQGNMETMNQLRQLALLALICSPLRSPAQQWPVHSLDRPRPPVVDPGPERRSEEHTSELQSRVDLVCRLLLEKKNNKTK